MKRYQNYHQGNANQDHNEVLSYPGSIGYHPKTKQQNKTKCK